MATDYDAPRRTGQEEQEEDSLDELKGRRNLSRSAVAGVEETDTAEFFELPGADLSGEELTVRVIPKKADEFTCTSPGPSPQPSRRHHRRADDLPRLRRLNSPPRSG